MTRDGQVAGQKLLVIGGSSGIVLETAKSARLECAEVILTDRDAKRLQLAARETGALKCEAFDATDSEQADSTSR